MISYILTKATEHFDAVKDLPLPISGFVDPKWENYRANMRTVYKGFGTIEDTILHSQNIGVSGFNHRGPSKEVTIRKIIAALEERWPEFHLWQEGIQESPFAMKNTLYEMKPGAIYSEIFFWHLEMYLAGKFHLARQPHRLLEIGSGSGELARIYKVLHPTIHYVLMDLPESLFFAEVYLRANFPTATFCYCDQPDWDVRAIGIHDFTFVPVSCWKPVQQAGFDYIINQGSLQEMPAATVQWYCDFIEHSGATGFLSLNYAPTPLRFSENWQLAWESIPGAIILSSPANFVEKAWRKISSA